MPGSAINKSVNIPLGLISIALRDKRVPQLEVLIAAKLVAPGHFSSDSTYFKSLCHAVGSKRRTVLKHLKTLYELGWVGFDKNSSSWYIRSWAWFRSANIFFRRESVSCSISDLPNFQALLLAALAAARIRVQKYVNRRLSAEQGFRPRKTIRSFHPAVNKRETAIQGAKAITDLPANALPYFGLSIQAMADMLYLSHTRACELKQQAISANYIKSTKRFQLVTEFTHPVPGLRKQLKTAFGEEAKKMRISSSTRKGCHYIQVLIQLHDEIHPLVKLRNVNYAKLLKNKFLRSITPVIKQKIA